MPMDASHMAGVIYREPPPDPSRPTHSRSQSQARPSEGPNEIDFGIPSVRPGLARIGRRLTEMSENFLYDEPRGSSESKRASRTSLDLAAKVPFMGDDPVFCPFCEKPLPPALLLQHMTAAVEELEKGDKTGVKPIANPRLSGVGAESAGMVKTISAPEGSTKLAAGATIKPDLQKKSSGLSSSRPVSPTTSAQLEKPVKDADNVDLAASKVPVDSDTLRKWARVAGIQLDLPEPEPEKPQEPLNAPAKPFPKLAPPPEDQSRSSSRNSSRFNLFGKTKARRDNDEEDDSDDDDMEGAGGYARLDAPASPEREEKDLPTLSRRSTERQVNGDVDTAKAAEPTAPAEPQQASDEEVRTLLKEVLVKVNEMSKSHASVLHSHSTLLTTLKIARSNLAMAEANAEMLEEQVKRQATAPKPATPAVSATPKTPVSTSMGPPPAPMSKPMPTRTATTGPGAGEGSVAKTEPSVPRRSAEATRPLSIQMPQSTNPRTPLSASSESSKGMFGFWSRNKDKVGEFMNSLPDLTPMAEKGSFDFAKSPTSPAVPYGAALPDQYRSPGLNRSKTVHGRAGESDSLPRSSSFTNVQAASSSSASTSAAPADPYTRELTRLRQLYQSTQGKMEAMSKELADLKKGKVEMEAELENLSQALFEEANKMVAEERKKRAELEESLKEVKDEREALRETIKVLGGQVDDKSNSSRGDPDEEQDDLGDLPEFQPRDLDKHYEALRKSIHHVADGAGNQWAESSPTQDEPKTPGESSGNAEVFKTPSQPRRHSLPDISSPEPQHAPALHDPWADPPAAAATSSNADVETSPSRSRRTLQPLTPAEELGPKDTGLGLGVSEIRGSPKSTSPSGDAPSSQGPVSPKAEKLDALDKMMEEMQADVVLDSPLKEKPNPFASKGRE